MTRLLAIVAALSMFSAAAFASGHPAVRSEVLAAQPEALKVR